MTLNSTVVEAGCSTLPQAAGGSGPASPEADGGAGFAPGLCLQKALEGQLHLGGLWGHVGSWFFSEGKFAVCLGHGYHQHTSQSGTLHRLLPAADLPGRWGESCVPWAEGNEERPQGFGMVHERVWGASVFLFPPASVLG